jgi:RNA polymerase sigma factor (sigma-70 family)
MAGAAALASRAAHGHRVTPELRELIPVVLGVLVRRGADFATAEDAVQEALLAALDSWATDPPNDPTAWLVTTAWRKFLDLVRSDTARRGREERLLAEPAPGPTEHADDTLQLYFLCAHPTLTPASAVALTLRAVGGLTTRQIAAAYLVPESTMAQRISRAKRAVSDVRFDTPGVLARQSFPVAALAPVLTTLYLVFNEGYSGDVDLAAEAIRLTRALAVITDDAEVDGLLALMLLHHARRDARTNPDGGLIPLAEQDRTTWNTEVIAEGVALLQAALARDELGPYQAQAAIAALHADAQTVEETDWVQIVEWYDELLALTDSPVVRLNRAVAVGQADGARAGLAALAHVEQAVPRYGAAAAFLHEQDGDLVTAARLYVEAAASAPNLAERDHLTRQAARLHQLLREPPQESDKNSPSDRRQSLRDRPPWPATAKRADDERERRD